MFTLHGQVLNIYVTPKKKHQETGREYGGDDKVQLVIEETLENGEKRSGIQDVTVEDATPYQALIGRKVTIPVVVRAFRDSLTVRAMSDFIPVNPVKPTA